MSADTGMMMRRERGWRMGLGNMLAKELSAWWRTRRWWVQCLAAVLLLNGTMALNLRGNSVANGAAMNFLIISALFVPLAAISLAQDAILGERHAGTAAWVFSKPLRRPAYILAKVIALGLGLLVTWVVLPVGLAYFQLGAATGHYPTVSGFAGAMGLIYLNLFFYLTLALMLATFFNGRGPVLGIAALLAFFGPLGFLAQPMNENVPWVTSILPWILTFPVGTENPLVQYVVSGQPLPTVTPIIASLLWCVLFIGMTIWRTGREEF